MKRFASIAAAALAAAAVMPVAAHAQTAPAAGQAAPGPVAGATVYDGAGAEVGKIESVANGVAVIFTGTNRASIPLTSLGSSPKGPTLGMTKAELDAATSAQAAAQVQSKLTPGAEVRGSAGSVLATVKAVEGDSVVLTTGKADVKVPVTGVGTNAQGLFIAMTQAQFDAAVAANGGAAAQR